MAIKNSSNLNGHIGILILRLFIGFRLLYGVVDNIANWEKMIEFSNFLANSGFPLPLVSAVISVYSQFFAALAILIGIKIRICSFIMVINFIVAILFVHLPAKDTIEGMTPAMAILFICITFIFTGAGKYSLQYYLSRSIEKHRTTIMMEANK